MEQAGAVALGITQAELAGRTGGPSASPNPGELLRDFTLPSTQGLPVSLSQYRGQSNLVLVYAGGDAGVLRSLAQVQPALAEEQTQILGIVSAPPPDPTNWENLPFPVLTDTDGSAHRAAGATDAAGRFRAAIYVADRFGEVFGAYREAEGVGIPSPAEILELGRFLNIRCEECGHTEWPAE